MHEQACEIFTFGLFTLILGCCTNASSHIKVVHAQTSATSHPECFFFSSDLYFRVAVKKVRCTSATNVKKNESGALLSFQHNPTEIERRLKEFKSRNLGLDCLDHITYSESTSFLLVFLRYLLLLW